MIRKLSPIVATFFALTLIGGVAWAATVDAVPGGRLGSESSTTTADADSTTTSSAGGDESTTTTVEDSTSTTAPETTTTTVDDSVPSTTAPDTTTTIDNEDDDTDEADDDDEADENGEADDQVSVEPGTYSYPLPNGGVVTVTIEGNAFVELLIDSPDGWSVDIEKNEPDRIRIEFTNGDDEIEIDD